MEQIELVHDVAQIIENCLTLKSYLTLPRDNPSRVFSEELIVRGTCFVPVLSEGTISFYPSRFIGYIANNAQKHIANETRDGRITNKAIEYALQESPDFSSELEDAYKAFCSSLGLKTRATGAFGVKRRYWSALDATETSSLIVDLAQLNADGSLNSAERETLTLARIGQGAFRKALLDEWMRCALTEIEVPEVLRASHIKAWRNCASRSEKLDPMNGVLLSANMDALFDKHLISFDNGGNILIAKRLSQEDRSLLNINKSMSIPTNALREIYMQHHRVIFSKLNDQQID